MSGSIPRYISSKGLEALAGHKYKAGDWSYLDVYMNVWWTAAVEWLPKRLAPNLVTLIGTIAIASTVVVTELFKTSCMTSGNEAVIATVLPPWVHVYIIACLFFYQTMDALDGKQARRTGSSSPLGQLFDHGCDALVTAIQSRNLVLCFGLGGHFLGSWLLVAACTVFFGAQLEEYFTRVLRTAPTKLLGVTEAQFLAMGVHALAAALPCEWWHTPLYVQLYGTAQTSRLLRAYIPHNVTMPRCHAIAYALLLLLAASFARFLLNLVAYHRHPDGAAGRLRALYYALPTLALGATTVYLTHPAGMRATRGLASPSIAGGAVLLGYALSATHVTNQMIVYSMCRDAFPVPAQAALLAFPALAVAAHVLPLPVSVRLAYAYVGAMGVLYLAFVAGAMRQICTRLGIRAFVIAPQPPAVPQAVVAPAPAVGVPLPEASPRAAAAAQPQPTAPPAGAAEEASAATGAEQTVRRRKSTAAAATASATKVARGRSASKGASAAPRRAPSSAAAVSASASASGRKRSASAARRR